MRQPLTGANLTHLLLAQTQAVMFQIGMMPRMGITDLKLTETGMHGPLIKSAMLHRMALESNTVPRVPLKQRRG